MKSKSNQAPHKIIKDLDNCLKTSAEYRNHYNKGKEHIAFIYWFSKAQYGETKILITDGSGDGGIDALIDKSDETIIIQSKYNKITSKKNIGKTDLNKFEDLKQLFTYKSKKDDFELWLNDTRSELKKTYTKLRNDSINGKKQLKFVFISTSYSPDRNLPFDCFDINHISMLWTNYESGYTPLVDSIELELKDNFDLRDSNNRFRTIVSLVDVRQFIKIMNNDPEDKLFAYNVRSYLRESPINKEIAKTYKKDPDSFWLGHNGIYMTSQRISHQGGKLYKLDLPLIINGSQTLHSIQESGLNKHCDILIRILEIDGQNYRDLLDSIIIRTNAQNAMRKENLISHDPWQNYIRVFLNQYKIFYERKEREWKEVHKRNLLPLGYMSIKIKDLAKLLALLKIDTHGRANRFGYGTIRNRTSLLIDPSMQGSIYKTIFSDFNSNYESKYYKDLIVILWSSYFVNNITKWLPRARKGQFKISRLLFINWIFDIIHSLRIQRQINILLHNHDLGKKINLKQRKEIKQIIDEMLGEITEHQKKLQEKDPSIDFSNLFKDNAKTSDVYNKYFRQKRINARIGQMLKEYIDSEK